ncbi:DUF4231 domain-containing protein [Mycoplasma phocoenae]|uniref:DUF4231 domain-containing protein n=1 Tax=Mycoplasma phocoenae TaxID=754517 RepID=A0A858U968_9MOLU|nr:DUF4231 domain-containing protein [Mycoplasma phocoenae]QJG67248.1 DUF4231 domain-containing protein [Mycoplasma phocoenae]
MHDDLLLWVKKMEKKLKFRVNLFSFWFYILNIAIMVVSLIISIFGTLQLYYKFNWSLFNGFSSYLLITTGIAALTTFLTSLIGFFVISKKISLYKSRLEKIQLEKLLWEEKIGEYFSKNRNLNYYINVSNICGISWEVMENDKQDTK